MLIGQLAATLVLVFACGLLARSFTSLVDVHRGFAHETRLLSVRLLPGPGGHQTPGVGARPARGSRSLCVSSPAGRSPRVSRDTSGPYPHNCPSKRLRSSPLRRSTPPARWSTCRRTSSRPLAFPSCVAAMSHGRTADTIKVALVSECLARDLDVTAMSSGVRSISGRGAPSSVSRSSGCRKHQPRQRPRDAEKLVSMSCVQANQAIFDIPPPDEGRTSRARPACHQDREAAGHETYSARPA